MCVSVCVHIIIMCVYFLYNCSFTLHDKYSLPNIIMIVHVYNTIIMLFEIKILSGSFRRINHTCIYSMLPAIMYMHVHVGSKGDPVL